MYRYYLLYDSLTLFFNSLAVVPKKLLTPALGSARQLRSKTSLIRVSATFWDILVIKNLPTLKRNDVVWGRVTRGLPVIIWLTDPYVQGDPGGKVNILGVDSIGHCEKNVYDVVWGRVTRGLPVIIWLTDPYVQGDPGGKVNILGVDSIGHCEKKVYADMCLILNGYRDTAAWISRSN
jgi:hypothetical protein